jgi:hypothetical protein
MWRGEIDCINRGGSSGGGGDIFVLIIIIVKKLWRGLINESELVYWKINHRRPEI